MPYEIKGNCIYKKDGGAKVGCTKGDVHKYMAALHANANESAIDSDIKTLIRTRLREGLFDNINDEDFKKAYINKINKLYDNLLVNVSLNQNYRFILGNKIVYNPCGAPNKCETNAYSFIKEKLLEGKSNYFPVGGFLFEGISLFPIEHWWVYDSSDDKFIEVTPLNGEKPRCYAGIINYEINDEIAKSNNVFDLYFFKGGNVFHKYFK